MRDPVTQKRLNELRTAAEVGIRMSGFHPHTVHVNPEELAALLEEVHIRRNGEIADALTTGEMARVDLKLAELRRQIEKWDSALSVLTSASDETFAVIGRPVVNRTREAMQAALGETINPAEVTS